VRAHATACSGPTPLCPVCSRSINSCRVRRRVAMLLSSSQITLPQSAQRCSRTGLEARKTKPPPLLPRSAACTNPRLCAAAGPNCRPHILSVCSLLTLVWPRNHVRRPPPVSHTCAKVRSHRSLRQRFNCRPLLPRTRRRLARNACSCSIGLSVQRRIFCRRSGI
jgi:hypothetical protein